ncbi:MAG: transporter substrate-binding domain-containing protein [Methanoregula sp.]|nr:transporter substrate-binding domain-containing protein [Methanoregula sp.]
MTVGKPSKNAVILFVAIIVLVLAAVSVFVFLNTIPAIPGNTGPEGAAAVRLTADEQQWISAHPDITVCPDPEYPPFEYFDNRGNYQGISADFLNLIAEKTGLHITVVHRSDWNSCIQMIKTNQTDLLGAVYISDLRGSYLNYTHPYYQPPLVIITRKDSFQNLTLNDLEGKTVVAVDNYTSEILLKEQYPKIYTLTVPNIGTGLKMVSYGQADAYFGDLASSSWVVDHQGLTNLQVSGEYLPPSPQQFQFAVGVRSNEPELREILNKGIAGISPDERDQIVDRWVSTHLQPAEIDFRILTAFLACIAILAILAIIIFAWNRSLRRAVDEKTRELKKELDERKKTEEALALARKKMTVLNAISIQDMETAVFSLSAYLQMAGAASSENRSAYTEKMGQVLQAMSESLKFARSFQALGLSPPSWQNVEQSFLLGISHMNLPQLERTLEVDGLEIYADPMFENVFFALAENIVEHAETATAYFLTSRESDEGLVLLFEDNGPGIPANLKEKIFDQEYGRRKGFGLYLSREILSLTGITIHETGEPGKGARFEIVVPKGAYRFTKSRG